jgi:hypothetical protein
MLRKVVAYYTKKLKNIQNEFLVMIWNCYHFLKHNIEVTKYLHTFKFSYLFKNDKQKNRSCIGTIVNIFYKNLQNISLKNSFVWKHCFWIKKTCHYEKMHSPKPHYPITRAPKTTHVYNYCATIPLDKWRINKQLITSKIS